MTRVLLLWILLLGTWGTSLAQGRVIALCFDETYARPWVNRAGTVILKATAALHKVEFGQTALPWLRCLQGVEKGSYAGAVGVSFSEERARFAAFPMNADGLPDAGRSMQVSSYSLYRLKGQAADWDGKAFQNLSSRVLVQRGYSVVADLAKMGVKVDKSEGDIDTVFKMLIAGRGQLGALVTEQGDELLLLPEYRKKLEKIKLPVVEKPYFLVFGKGFYAANAKLVDDLWSSLAVVRDARNPDSGVKQKATRP